MFDFEPLQGLCLRELVSGQEVFPPGLGNVKLSLPVPVQFVFSVGQSRIWQCKDDAILVIIPPVDKFNAQPYLFGGSMVIVSVQTHSV